MRVTTDPAKMGRGPAGSKTTPETKSPAATHGPKKLPPKGAKKVQGRVKVRKVPFQPSKKKFASKIGKAGTYTQQPGAGASTTAGKDRNRPTNKSQSPAYPAGLVATLQYRKAARTAPVGKF